MRENKSSANLRETSKEALPIRTGVLIGTILILVVLLGVAFVFKPWKKPAATPVTAPVASAVEEKPHVASLPPLASVIQAPKPAPVSRPATAAPTPVEQMTTSQLVDELSSIGAGGTITPEQAARFKLILAQLIQRGAASVPAIQDLLGKKIEVSYGGVSGGNQLGYASLRTSLIDALNQIGGPEAQTAMLATLQSPASPSELQQLAQDLNQQAPGQYQDQIIAAAQAALKMAQDNQFGTNANMQSIFRILQTYGGANSGNAANSDPVQLYSAVQLANLPNGQGLSSLVQMAQTSSGSSQAIATQMIAQMAGQNTDALTALSKMAQNGQIQAGDWVHLAPILGGDQYQFDSSGQNPTMVSSATTPDQIDQRLMLIDAFMNLVPDGSGAQKALQQEHSVLVGRLGSN